MVKRIWHGYTTRANADAYEHLLKNEVLPGIAAKNIDGYRSVEVLRRTLGDEVEFITMMSFDSLDAIKDLIGEDYETAYVPPAARAVLARFDERSSHYEVREQLTY